MSLNVHKFAAIRGRQSGDDYLLLFVKWQLSQDYFYLMKQLFQQKLRAQRHINKTRIPEMARYMVDNPKNYIFSALTASIDGKIEFNP